MKKAFHRKLPGHPVAEQRGFTAAFVPLDRDSWTHGDGAETIHTLTQAFEVRKNQSHELYLGMDLRVLGDSMDDIRKVVKRLHAAGVTIIDATPGADTDIIDMLAAAQKRMRWNGDRRHQKNKGKRGGDAKRVAAEAKRNAIMSKDAVMRMKAHPKLTLRDCAHILGPAFSVATLRRNY